MCGILIVAERHGPVDERRFGEALRFLSRRGPDGEGVAHWPPAAERGGASLALGHRRLSILDLTATSSQPFRREGAAMIYNGEIYNFRALRAGLGGHFDTDGDTEVLFRLLRERGLAGFADAIGMWALCLFDEATGRILAARDGLGKKPLFYYADQKTICFASEVGAISTYLMRPPRISQPSVDTYLAYGWMLPGSKTSTPFEGISQVEPGGHVSFDLASWRLEAGRHLDFVEPMASSPAVAEDLGDTLKSAVLDRLVSDRKVGLLLSGGIDSSLILSILASEGRHDQVQCFIGDAGRSEDAIYAMRVVKDLGIAAEVIPIDYGNSRMTDFLDICRRQAKPFPLIGNVLALPQLYQRIAERDVPVILDGTGADEIFGGYWERYSRFALLDAWRAGHLDWIERFLAANADLPRIDKTSRATIAALRAGTWPPRGTIGAEPTTDIVPLLAAFCRPEVANAAPADPLARRACSLGEALRADVTSALLPEWLWQNDRNAMRSGVENRSPFLDRRLVGYVHSDYRRKFDGRWNKHELRPLFDRFRPAATQWRREKQGFRWTFAKFLRANRATVLELITASRLVAARVRVFDLIDAIGRDEELLFSDLTQRCLCLAGIEAATGLSLGDPQTSARTIAM